MANVDLMVLAGDYVKTAVVSEVKVKVGDTVKKGDILLEVETNKITQGIEAPCDGVVQQILVEDGDDVEISKTVVVIGDETGAASAAPAPKEEKVAPAAAAPAEKDASKAYIDLMVLAGDYVKTAVISEFKVKIGDAVKKGDVLLEVETNKITQGIESPIDGVVEEIFFEDGDDVEISKTVMVIGNGSAQSEAPKPAGRVIISPVAKKLAKEKGIDIDALAAAFPGKKIGKDEVLAFEAAPAPAAEAPAAGGRIAITPVAKKMAKEKGISIDALAAAFPGKKIGKEDVLAFEAAPAPAAEPAPAPAGEPAPAAAPAPAATITEVPFKGMRKAVANAMKNSAYNKPHVTMMIDADIDALLEMKSYLKKAYPDKKVTLTGLLALAVRNALIACPYMNGTTTEEAILQNSVVNLGIAVDIPGGLMVPIIKNTNGMGGLELFDAVNAVAKGCREGSLGPSDYAGGTFSITNIGAKGVKYFTPIINSPEIAILGVGGSRKEFEVVDGNIVSHTMLGLSLSFDHAAVDGSPAAEFLKVLKENIEHPYMMAL